ncbi:MAG: hypothetical protein AB8E82_14985 [Aureispira sp.]
MIINFFRNIGRYLIKPFFARYWKRLAILVIVSYTIVTVGHQNAWFRSPILAVNPFEAFSEHTALLLETPSGKHLPPNLTTANYSTALLQLSILDKWQRGVHLLDSLFGLEQRYQTLLDQTAIVSGVQVISNQAADWLYVLKMPSNQFQLEAFIEVIRPKHIQKSTYRGYRIYTLSLHNQEELTFTQFKGLVLMSRTTVLVESSIEQLDDIEGSVYRKAAFQAVMASPKEKPTWNIYFNFKAFPSLTNVVTTPNPRATLALRQVGNWMCLDAQFLPKDFNLRGVLIPELDNAFLQALAQQKAPQKSRMIELFPSNLGALLYIGWNDFDAFYDNYNTVEHPDFEAYIQPWLGQDAALFYEDPTDEQNIFEKDKLVFLHSKDTSLTWKLLDKYAQKIGPVTRYGYQNFEITHLPAENVLEPLFGKTINPLQAPYFTIVGEYIVLANSKTTLEGWIKAYNTRMVLLELPEYKAFLKQSSEQSNIYLLINTPNTNKFVQYLGRNNLLEYLQTTWKGFKNIYPIGIKLHGQNNHFLTTLSASYNQVTEQKKVKATAAWQADLNSKAAIAPQALHSHDGNYYVLVQDERHQLYLFDKNGENQWPAHKKTNRRINSSIFEVNYYNNNEIQYAFSTDSAIYILTKEGQTLMTIPLIHRAASGVLAVGTGKEPRLFIPCKNGAIYGYEQTGKPLSGWQPLKGVGRVDGPMQYMRYQDKSYFIALTKAGHAHAYNQAATPYFKHARLGKATAWGVDPIIGRIVAGQANGKIKVLNSKGKGFNLAAVPELKKKVQFLYADVIGDARKDYIRMDANQLVIHYYEKQTDEKGRSKDKLIQTPIYTIPEAKDRQIFEVTLREVDKKLIGYWEPSTNSIGLLNAKGKLQKGFPLAGTSAFEVIDLFEEQSNTLIVANDSRVYTYKLK